MDAGFVAWRAEAVNLDVSELAQLAERNSTCTPAPAIYLRGVFAGQEADAHGSTILGHRKGLASSLRAASHG